MGKFADFILSDSWEEFQRIQLYKGIETYLKEKQLSKEDFEKIKEILEKKK